MFLWCYMLIVIRNKVFWPVTENYCESLRVHERTAQINFSSAGQLSVAFVSRSSFCWSQEQVFQNVPLWILSSETLLLQRQKCKYKNEHHESEGAYFSDFNVWLLGCYDLCHIWWLQCSVKIGEWKIEDIVWYLGYEPKRDPHMRYLLCFSLRWRNSLNVMGQCFRCLTGVSKPGNWLMAQKYSSQMRHMDLKCKFLIFMVRDCSCCVFCSLHSVSRAWGSVVVKAPRY